MTARFNGAALNCAEKDSTITPPRADSSPLQWGRAELRGKGGGDSTKGGGGVGFNGAALNCAEKGRHSPCKGRGTRGFNGAALNCAEKERFRPVYKICVWWLQWGRAELRGKGVYLTGGRGAKPCFNGAALNCAEKEPYFSAASVTFFCFNGAALNCAEKGVTGISHNLALDASMGPR